MDEASYIWIRCADRPINLWLNPNIYKSSKLSNLISLDSVKHQAHIYMSLLSCQSHHSYAQIKR
jgi:hypothetical protein